MTDDEKKDLTKEDEKNFFEDLLDDLDDNSDENDESTEKSEKEKVEEEQRKKNKDAEEARKRREAEAKAKAEEEAKKKAEEEAKKKAEEDAKKADEEAKKKAEADTKKKNEQTTKLGEQLVEFKKKYPDVELAELDNDKSFKKFIDGKLLGKKEFTQLYEEYLEVKSELSGQPQEDVRRNYERKAQSSSGSSTPKGGVSSTEIYSEDELEKITRRLPLMSDAEANKVMAKFDKSIEFYKTKNKK